MRILVVGSGGREHTLVWKLKQSRTVKKIYVAPGNAGIGLIANTVNIEATNVSALANFAEKNNITMTVVGPEQPLAAGIVDEFTRRKLPIFGPTKAAAELESSKAWSKEFMRKYHIPTAPFQIFTEAAAAITFLKTAPMPIVIKADGLAAGKGAIVAKNLTEAIKTIDLIMTDKIFGKAGEKVVIETCLEGQELSVMAFSDGKNIKMMLPSQDHKQIFDGDTGPNTGGMGAYCPAPFVTESTLQFVKEHVMEPTVAGMAAEGRKYKGVLYAGLMLTQAGPKVIEFNCRFGDPETQAVLSLLKSELTDIIMAVIDGNLTVIKEPVWDTGAAACIILASKGYPGKAETGKRIFGLRNYSDMHGYLFHSATKKEGKNWVTTGGRVVGVTASDFDLNASIKRAYQIVNKIKFDGMQYRKDIGFKANRKVEFSRI